MKPAGFWDWLGPFILVMAFIVYLSVSTPREFNSCPADGDCFFAWFSAMSGWVAAAGALVAALLALPYLSSQAQEAKRQADFAVGDTEPEFVLARNRRQAAVKLVVTNWNRRNVMIDSVTCIEPAQYRVSRYWDAEESEKSTPQPKLLLVGWYNRGDAPRRRSLILQLECDGGLDPSFARSGKAIAVIVKYRIIGQLHERREAYAKAIDIDSEEI